MAKIFGTSSEDEGNSRNSKPPTPNTSAGKTAAAKPITKAQKLCIDQVYSDSDSEKRLDSPALMSDSDGDVPSRPPTPSFPAAKASQQPKQPSKKSKDVLQSGKLGEEATEKLSVKQKSKDDAPLADSSDDESTSKNEQERNRRLSAHDRQKERENLFDSLLTVNVDLPSKPPTWKSPGGSLKSPNIKSPGKSSISPGHKSPMVSPGGKPTYLLAHTFGGDRSVREAEKIHRAQEREMHKKGSDRITKETFKTKKDLEDSLKQQKGDNAKSGEDGAEGAEGRKPSDNLKEHKDVNEILKKSEIKSKDKDKSFGTANVVKDDGEKSKNNDVPAKLAKDEGKHKKKAKTEEVLSEKKVAKEKSREDKKQASDISAKDQQDTSAQKENAVDQSRTASKKPVEAVLPNKDTKTDEINATKKLSNKDSVYDFKDEVEIVGGDSKLATSKKIEKSADVALVAAPKEISPDYASFAAQTKIEATSSPSPASEDDDAPLLIIADDVDEIQEVNDGDIKEVTEIKKDHGNTDMLVNEAKQADEVHNKSATGNSSGKQLKLAEPTKQEQLEKSIASITNDAKPDTITDLAESDNGTFVPATAEQKRTVISQEETENAINALLGESFESFDEPVEPSVASRTVGSMDVGGDDETAAAVAGLADDEAASAVLGLATEMRTDTNREVWHNVAAANNKQQEDESIENIAAEIRRSSTDSVSSDSKEFTEAKSSGDQPKVQTTSPIKKQAIRDASDKMSAQSQNDVSGTNDKNAANSKAKTAEDKEAITALGSGRKLSEKQSNEQQKSHDVFDFKVDDEQLKPPRKAIERPKQIGANTSSVDSVIEGVVKSSYEDTVVSPPLSAKSSVVKDRPKPSVVLATPGMVPLQQPIQVATNIATSSPSAATMSPVVGRESPLPLPRGGSTDSDKNSPQHPLASPNSSKSPNVRPRRPTGSKSRDAEEESPDTKQKINRILEQAKQEAERSAHNQAHLASYRAPDGSILVGQQASPPSHDVLIDPKTGQVVTRQPVPNSVTLTLVTSSGEIGHQHPTDLRVAPRTGVPQPTVLPQRHEQQVRSGQNLPRVGVAPARPPRPTLPIQLPTQPLPPESVKKAQPVLLEPNQPTKLPRVALPTEPVPRSVASQMPSLPRTPLPFSSAHLVTTQPPKRLITTSLPMTSRAQVTAAWPTSPVPPRTHANVVTETGQRVSLNKREGNKEADQPAATDVKVNVGQSSDSTQAPMKVRGDYLQPREREVHRPASTPLSTQPLAVSSSQPQQQQQYDVPAAHLASSAQQFDAEQQRTMDLVCLANYRDFTTALMYNQLMNQQSHDHVAQNLSQNSRYGDPAYRAQPAHEEPRPGSVPPSLAMHHMEEIRRQQKQKQQIASRQPLPAHNSQVDTYRQTDSPHGPMYLGTHSYSSHIDTYRRPGVGPEPPAAHSGQHVARATQSPTVNDYYMSPRPTSPAYNPSMSDYRLPHLAAYPICWSGTLGLKNDMANVRMHYVSGNRDLAKASLPDTGSTLKIMQRMRLEDSQLDGVARKMETKSEHCMLLALPNGSEHEEIEHQSKILRSNFITYLQLKSAAGIVNVSNEDNQPAYIVHVFPSCDFANENLARIAPNLLHRVADIEHLVIVIATVFDVNR